jgi:acyl dehydratase
VRTGGPFFDDLVVGDVFDSAPSLTIGDGHAVLHQAIVGDRLRLALDRTLSEKVLGSPTALAHPALVCDIAIGQSTVATQRVIANLFYRGLVFRRAPVIGDTLHTRTEVVGLRRNRSRPGRPETGLAVLRIRTTDQEQRRVLDFWRCAMLPVRDPVAGRSRQQYDLDQIPADLDPVALQAATASWDLDAFRAALAGPHSEALVEGTQWEVERGDVVNAAPELARLTLNVAATHHDADVSSDGQRLVYGGHTIGIAASQVTRTLPNLVTIVAWHSCDHTGPVFEGDTLRSTVELQRVAPRTRGALVHLRARVYARRVGGAAEVLDWRFVGVMA